MKISQIRPGNGAISAQAGLQGGGKRPSSGKVRGFLLPRGSEGEGKKWVGDLKKET
jgi:hypothetical protein